LVLTFQLAYKLLAAIVFVPLFGIIFNKLLYFGGYANATNDELLAFLKTPYGQTQSLLIIYKQVEKLIHSKRQI
jgi:hypothetical protein